MKKKGESKDEREGEGESENRNENDDNINGNDNEIDGKYTDNSLNGIIAIGVTGSGKSTAMKQLTGDKTIETCSNSESTTENVSFYPMKYSKNIMCIDTPGFLDSKGKKEDEIVYDIKKKCNEKNIKNLKIIWCLKHKEEKANQAIKFEAEFINKLTKKNWKSVLIVQKAKETYLGNGAISAAMELGRKIFQTKDEKQGQKIRIDSSNPHYIGAWVIDYIDDDEKEEECNTFSCFVLAFYFL